MVSRSRYRRLQALLVIACIAIVGLSIAVGLAPSAGRVSRPAVARTSNASASAETADTGARLDHRGLHDAAYLAGLADVGARLDHRGRRSSRGR